ncbi:MAG: cysteine synthase family protein [Anaerolineales bacterium]|nr:cysteine synthase family protein [Anaerolineales bacterium]
MLHTDIEPTTRNGRTAVNTPSTIADQVGNTPLIRLKRTAERAGLPETVELYAKAEWFNPSGSVKDRPALSIIRAAERDGRLRPGMTLLDSTSGNMGIAYAMLGAARGYKVKLALPANASPERIAILKAYGAELILTDPLEGSDGAILEARRIAAEDPSIFYANQYSNPANWQAHYQGTAVEIWDQTFGRVTHFTTGLGTSGTFVGTSRRLKEYNQEIVCISSQPDSPFNGLEGWKHMPTAITPAIYDETIADGNIDIRTEDAYVMARDLARYEGLFVGISAAGSIVGMLQVARQLDEGVVVTVLPDNGFKYLSERFWDENK